MLNVLKKITSAGIAFLIMISVVFAFTRLNGYQVNADTTDQVSLTLAGTARMQTYGNKKGSFKDGVLTIGKKGKKRIEAVTLSFKNTTGYEGGLRYMVYVQKKGWTDWTNSGKRAGTVGKNLRVEAIRIELTGELAKHYSVVYSAYMQTFKAKQGWVNDGAVAGSAGDGKRVQEIQVKIVPRESLGETPTIAYRMYRDHYKWSSSWYRNGAVAGVTSGSYQKHEGLMMTVTNTKYTGTVEYRARGDGYSWSSWCKNNSPVGKFKKKNGKRMEEVQVRLTGELAEHFDVYYRTCAREKGWLGWAKNGESSGTEKYGYYIMAFQCVLVPKGSSAPGDLNGIKSKYTSTYLVNGNPVLKFADFKADYKKSNTMLGMDVSKYQGNIDFKKAKAAGVEFVILRCYVRNNYYDKTKKKYVWCNAPDTKFEQYYKDAKAAGLKVGLYFFTCDYTEENMRKYTQDMIKKCKLNEKQIDFPIAFDWENFDYYKRAHKSKGWSTSTMNKHIDEDLNKMVAIFEEEVEKAGYTASIYGSKSRLEGTWSPSIKAMNQGKNNLSIWMAHWVSKSSYKGSYYMWQVNSHGRVPGISGDVDLDIAYIDRLPPASTPVKPDEPDKPEEPKDNGGDAGDTGDTGNTENTNPAEDPKTPETDGDKTASGEEGVTSDEGAAPDEDPTAIAGGSSSPDEDKQAPAEDEKASSGDQDEDIPSKEDLKPAEQSRSSVPVVKAAEPEKDQEEPKDAVPAKQAQPKEQPEEARTAEP